jgi:DNA-binding CsgD family transcriptional regulator
MNEDERHRELVEKLEVLIRLQAHNLIANLDSQREKILRLSRAGLTPKAIAEIIGSSPNAVSVALSKAKKGGAEDA